MLLRELAQGVEDMLFNFFSLGIWFGGIIWYDGRREIGVVDGVVDGDGNLKARVVVDYSSGDTSPHRLVDDETSSAHVMIMMLTVRWA